MSLKKSLKIGQAALEYTILLAVISMLVFAKLGWEMNNVSLLDRTSPWESQLKAAFNTAFNKLAN